MVGAGHEPWQPVRVKWWIVLLVFGGVVAVGVTGIYRGDGKPGEIKCGSEIMQPGDVCQETRRGRVTDTQTYEAKVEEIRVGAKNFDSKGRWIQFGIGLGFMAIAVTGMIVTKRRRARKPPTTADLYLQQQAAWQQQPAQPAHFQQPPQWHPQHVQQQPYQQQPYQQQQPYPPQQRQYPDFGPRG